MSADIDAKALRNFHVGGLAAPEIDGAIMAEVTLYGPAHLLPATIRDFQRAYAALLDAYEERERLREALRWFLEDDRFDVAVGGNPIAVDEMIEHARAALKEPAR